MTKINESALSHLRKDKILRKIIDTTPLFPRVKKESVYHSLLGSIISQQLSTKAAATIHQRFLDIFDGQPHPELVIRTDHTQLRSCGLSNQKANYVKNLATYFLDQPIEKRYWNKFEDEEIIQMLSSIKGIGKWTVQMTLMFTLERPDVFPIDDLIIKNSVIHYYNLDRTDKNLIQNVHKIAEKWSPYRSFACYYFWAAKDNLK